MALRKLTPLEVFFEMLKNDTLKGLPGDELKVDEQVVIDEGVVDWDFRIIKDVTFEELVRISHVEIASGLIFINCTFKKGITIRGLSCIKFDTTLNRHNYSVSFSNCRASFVSFSEGCKFDRGILIEEKCEIGIIKVYQTGIKNHDLKIDDSVVARNIDINQVKGSIKIANSTINKSIRVENTYGDVSFIRSTIKGSIQVWNVECPNSFTLNWNIFGDTFKISGSRIKLLAIHGDEFQKNFDLENRDVSGGGNEAYLKELYITEANFVESGEINGLGKEIDKITLPITPKLRGVIRLANWRVNTLSISGISLNLKLLISQFLIKRLSMIEFNNYGDITFDRCAADNENFKTELNPNSSILTAHSDLGSAKFTEFDFNSFDFLHIDNTSLNDVITSNVIWFDDNRLRTEESQNSNFESFQRRREIYRQIKQSLKSKGNQIDSLIFQARELNAYRDERKASGNYGLGDRIIMLTSMSNNYGLSWLKPIVLVISLTLMYYFLIVPMISSELVYVPSFSIEDLKVTLIEFWNRKEVLFQLFNPARRFSTVYGTNYSDWLYLWDALHRVLLGVLIFQIIKAFRKFAGK